MISSVFKIITKRHIKFLLIFALIFTGLALIFGTKIYFPNNVYEQDNTYYVAKTGSDSNPGTVAQPWLTIQKAANAVVAGDTVYVRSGTYNEQINVTSKIGTAIAHISFKVYPSESVVIDSGGRNNIFSIANSTYVTVSGFEMKNSYSFGVLVEGQSSNIIIEDLTIHSIGGSAILCGNDTGLYTPTVHNILIDGCNVYNCCTSGTGETISLITVDNFEITNCLVHDAPVVEGNQQAGIDAKYGCTNGKIHNNEVYDVGCGIYVGNINQGVTSNIDVYNNLIHGCTNIGSTGILLDSENSPISMNNINMYNNILYGNYRGIEVFWEVGVGSTTKTFSIINNTFYHNGGAGLTEIYLADTTGYVNCVVENNLIVGSNDNTLMICNKATSGVMIDHNLFYDAAGYYPQGTDYQDYGTNYIQANPLLVSPETGNFNIAAGSPAIGAGLSILAPAFDFIGTSRPQGMGYDIGAYEYETAPGSAP